MYQSSLKIKASKAGIGKGVFTSVDIPAKSPVMEITGEIRTEEGVDSSESSNWLQISPKLFIGLSGGVDDMINHSCDPNCYVYAVGKRAILYSLYLIKAGSEITFDYSTTSTDTLDSWKMDCKCNSYKCRKVISGYQYLDKSLRAEYEKKGMVPLFMTDKRFKGE